MSTNWLEGFNHDADGPGQPRVIPAFEGRKLVVAAGGSAVIRDMADGGVMAGRD